MKYINDITFPLLNKIVTCPAKTFKFHIEI